MNNLIFFISLMTALSIAPASTNAQEYFGTLEIVIDDNFPPYTVQNSDETTSGLFVEILRSALQHTHIKFNIIGRPWKRVIAMTDRSEIDASLPWRSKKERFEKYNMVGPITKYGSKTIFWVRKDFTLDGWSHLKDLSEYRIGTISGYAYPKQFEEATYLKKLEMTTTNRSLIKMLSLGRIDLIIGDEHVLATEALAQNLSGKFKQVGPALETVKRYIAVPKAKKDIAALIGKALTTFQDTPQYQDIIQRYQ
ncbi:MAG: transporter substrate-binding domain-containing protein [Halopseudomonas aestusnigri]